MVLLVATVIAFAQGTTPSQCVEDLRKFSMQRQAELRTALPPLPQQPTDDELRILRDVIDPKGARKAEFL